MNIYKKVVLAILCAWSSFVYSTTWQGTVNGVTYDFSTVTGTFYGLQSTLTSQVWWGASSSDTELFATTLADHLGLDGNGAGPYFAYGNLGWDPTWFIGRAYSYDNSWNPMFGGSPINVWDFWESKGSVNTFAVATPTFLSAAAPEIDGHFLPQTLLLLGGLTLLNRRAKRSAGSYLRLS